MFRSAFLALLALLLSGFGAAVQAATIYHFYSGTASGTIGGNSFTDVPILISATINSGDLVSEDFGRYYINHQQSVVNIQGLGSFEIQTGLRTFLGGFNPDVVGLSRAGRFGYDLLDFDPNPAFVGWNLVTPIGPVSVIGTTSQWNLEPLIETTGGTLEITSFTNGSFRASTVPEPSVAAVLLLGPAMLVMRRSRRTAHAELARV